MDQEMLEKARSGDSDTIAILYSMAYEPMRTAANAVLHNTLDAEDAAMDAVETMLQKVHQLDKPESFLTWAKQIAVNKAKDYVKKKKPILIAESEDGEAPGYWEKLEDVDTENMPEFNMDRQESRRLVRDAVKTLGKDLYTVLKYVYVDEMKLSEISEKLGVNLNTIKTRKRTAEKKLYEWALEQEKQGIYLHGMTPVEFWLWLLRNAKGSIVLRFDPSSLGKVIQGSSAATAATTAARLAQETASSGFIQRVAQLIGPLMQSAMQATADVFVSTTIRLSSFILAVVISALGISGGVLHKNQKIKNVVRTAILDEMSEKGSSSEESPSEELSTSETAQSQESSLPDIQTGTMVIDVLAYIHSVTGDLWNCDPLHYTGTVVNVKNEAGTVLFSWTADGESNTFRVDNVSPGKYSIEVIPAEWENHPVSVEGNGLVELSDFPFHDGSYGDNYIIYTCRLQYEEADRFTVGTGPGSMSFNLTCIDGISSERNQLYLVPDDCTITVKDENGQVYGSLTKYDIVEGDYILRGFPVAETGSNYIIAVENYERDDYYVSGFYFAPNLSDDMVMLSPVSEDEGLNIEFYYYYPIEDSIIDDSEVPAESTQEADSAAEETTQETSAADDSSSGETDVETPSIPSTVDVVYQVEWTDDICLDYLAVQMLNESTDGRGDVIYESEEVYVSADTGWTYTWEDMEWNEDMESGLYLYGVRINEYGGISKWKNIEGAQGGSGFRKRIGDTYLIKSYYVLIADTPEESFAEESSEESSATGNDSSVAESDSSVTEEDRSAAESSVNDSGTSDSSAETHVHRIINKEHYDYTVGTQIGGKYPPYYDYWTCPYCGKRFITMSQKDFDSLTWRSNLDNYVLVADKEAYRQHIVKEGGDPDTVGTPETDGIGYYMDCTQYLDESNNICSECSEYISEENLENLVEEYYECDICGFTCTEHNGLDGSGINKHMREEHAVYSSDGQVVIMGDDPRTDTIWDGSYAYVTIWEYQD